MISDQLRLLDLGPTPEIWRGMPTYEATPKIETPRHHAYVGGHLPRFPVFVLTKGRWERRLTVKMLERLGIPYRLVVEAQEVDQYARYVDVSRMLVVPHRDQGLVTTQNWVWDRAKEEGHSHFWAIHDDIRSLYRLNRQARVRVDGTALYVIEEMALRYDNVVLAGMNFAFRVWPSRLHPPVRLNVLIPGNHRLVRTDWNDLRARDGHGWEDHDLCLRVVKSGGCTMLFNWFLADTSEGINTKPGGKVGGIDFGGGYARRLTDELIATHPDAVIGRRSTSSGVRPTVTYRRWWANELVARPGLVLPEGANEYGMVLRQNDQNLCSKLRPQAANEESRRVFDSEDSVAWQRPGNDHSDDDNNSREESDADTDE